eukprot:6753140-Prymnesium_polylepis.1
MIIELLTRAGKFRNRWRISSPVGVIARTTWTRARHRSAKSSRAARSEIVPDGVSAPSDGSPCGC